MNIEHSTIEHRMINKIKKAGGIDNARCRLKIFSSGLKALNKSDIAKVEVSKIHGGRDSDEPFTGDVILSTEFDRATKYRGSHLKNTEIISPL